MLRRAFLHLLLAAMVGLSGPMAVSAAEPAAKPLPAAVRPQAALTALAVYPRQVTLDGPRDKQQLIVLG